MENRLNPAGEGQSQKKEWYKNWWGIIIALIIWPLFALWYITKKAQWSDEKKGFAIIGVIILTVVMFRSGDASDSRDKAVVQENETKQAQQAVETKAPIQEATPINTAENTPQVAETPKQSETKIPKYEIVYEVTGKRYDGAKIYYVLIDSINLEDNSFKNDIKSIIKKIVEEKGSKISIDIFDKKTVLEASYSEVSAQKVPTPKENTEAETHYVAMFSGELKTNIYPNTLTFFGSTFTDNKLVGRYVETIELNPNQN